ncbi:hypothetical protein ACFVUH_30435 [Kitasatospora sp. NPDC058032]|uniref:hypothetical protein n=1 Tax=Kitasatospora sp. NPDC058032 TaxID=3346307 RepID=UPI0036DF83E6
MGSDAFADWYRTLSSGRDFEVLAEAFGRVGIHLVQPGFDTAVLLDVEGEHVRLPAARVAELVGLSLGDLTLKWWFTADSDLVCGITYSGHGREKHTYFLDSLTAREADTVEEVLLGQARACPGETLALVVDRTGRTAEFDWDAVIAGTSAAVPRLPEALVLTERTADALNGLPAAAHRSPFAPGLTLLSGR